MQRLEFSAGYTNISFDSELRTQAFSAITGEQLVDTKENLPAGRDINLGVGSAALVFDNSLFGATGPILGQRYRLEASPAFGSLDFVGVLRDPGVSVVAEIKRASPSAGPIAEAEPGELAQRYERAGMAPCIGVALVLACRIGERRIQDCLRKLPRRIRLAATADQCRAERERDTNAPHVHLRCRGVKQTRMFVARSFRPAVTRPRPATRRRSASIPRA